MKLLLDENLFRRLVPALHSRFPGSSQVALLGLERSTDAQLCDYAALHGFVICSKDDDFQRLVAARDYRPRLIHLAMGSADSAYSSEARRCAADAGATPGGTTMAAHRKRGRVTKTPGCTSTSEGRLWQVGQGRKHLAGLVAVVVDRASARFSLAAKSGVG